MVGDAYNPNGVVYVIQKKKTIRSKTIDRT